MDQMQYVKQEKVTLKGHPEFNERWLQDRIAEDPTILGLGKLILKDKERIQPRAGRLDLLLQDPETNLRYEVEVQLGKTDESHIIRTIEYWDLERKRYPQYDHVAVLVAEDVTSRFLNVISLFNGVIPLLAVQMNAVKVRDMITLVCTTVLDQRVFGIVDEDEDEQDVTDRLYWEKRGTEATVKMADEVLEIVRGFDPELELKYNKLYIGMAKSGQPCNFVIFRAQKKALRMEARLPRSDEMEDKLETAGLDVLEYSTRNRRFKIRLAQGEIEEHTELLTELLGQAYREHFGS